MRAGAAQRAQALSDCVKTIREAALKKRIQGAAKRLRAGDPEAAEKYRQLGRLLQQVSAIHIEAQNA